MSRRGIDPVIFSCALGLMAFGIVMIYSTSHILALDRYGDPYHFVKRHIMWAGIGVVSMLLAARVDIRSFRPLAFPVFVLSAVGLLMVFIPGIGREAGGARRWISLGPMSVQQIGRAHV
jgi:cell division protein FtsW